MVKTAVAMVFSGWLGCNGIWWAWPISWIVTDLFLFGFYTLRAVPKMREENWAA